jgi:hypothetical protein
MFQRVISSFLVPALLFQVICSVHAQEGSCPHGPCGHDPSPHFHLCMVFSHDHDGCDQDLDADPHHPGNDAFPCPVRTHCHDDDAIYVPGNMLLGLRRSNFQSDAKDCPPLASIAEISGVPLATALLPRLTHPPPLPGQHCPLYLRTLTLLI